MLAKNTLHLQYSPAFKAVEVFKSYQKKSPLKAEGFLEVSRPSFS